MEFKLEKHPNNISFSNTFDLQRKIRRDRGAYFVDFDPRVPSDVSEFIRLFQERSIDISGYSPKALAKIDPNFKEPEIRRILEELQVMRERLPGLYELENSKQAELEVIKAAMDENTDLDKVDSFIDTVYSKQKEFEAASVKARTAERNVSALESRLREQFDKIRKDEAEKLRMQLNQAASEFNEQIRNSYRNFWAKAQKLFPQISGLMPFPREVYYVTPEFNTADAIDLKTLKSHPAVRVFPDRIEFHLKPIENQS